MSRATGRVDTALRLAAFMGMTWLASCGGQPPSACERAYAAGDYPGAVRACRAASGSAPNPRAKVKLAQSLLQLEQLDDAAATARELLEGPTASPGHAVLAGVARLRGEWAEAAREAERALASSHDIATRMVAASELARARWRLGEWDAALRAIAIMQAAARARRDRAFLRDAALLKAQVLRSIGDTTAVEDALIELSADLDDCQRLWPTFILGMTYEEAERPAQATAAFEWTLATLPRCPQALQVPRGSVLKNLASARYASGDLEGASAALVQVEASPEVALLRARIAARSDDLAAASAVLDQARTLPMPDADWRWEIDYLSAQVAESAGRLDDAEANYRRAIGAIGALRRGAASHDGFTVARYRPVYEGLVALLAHQARWSDALDVVLELDASDMLRATSATHGIDSDRARLTTDAAPPPAAEVVRAWRRRELVIIMATSPRQIRPGGERAYRLWLHDGRVDGDDIGDAATLRRWSETLFADPSDADAARGLGLAVVPPDASTRTLEVLAVGPLAKIPVAALRDADGPLLARRPLARVLSLRPRAPGPSAPGREVVIADPQGNLPAASREGVAVAAQLDAMLFAGDAATTERLWAAADAAVLHLALHVEDRVGQRVLRLADRAVAPAEIVARALTPRLVVLASCGAAAAHDEEGWGSLAFAFLLAGSEQVIAADRTVDDRDTAALVAAFYRHPRWREDPARALAAAQRTMAATASGGSIAAFTLLLAPPRMPR